MEKDKKKNVVDEEDKVNKDMEGEPSTKKRFVEKKSGNYFTGAAEASVTVSSSFSNSEQQDKKRKRTQTDVRTQESSLHKDSPVQVKDELNDKSSEINISASLDSINIRSKATLESSVLRGHNEGLAPPGRFIGPVDVVSALTHLLHRAPFPLMSFC